MYWGIEHSAIATTTCRGFVSSRREKVPLYHSLVFAPRNSKVLPAMIRKHGPSASPVTSRPFHVPWRAAESDLWSVEHPDTVSSTTETTKPSITDFRFIHLPFRLFVCSSP